MPKKKPAAPDEGAVEVIHRRVSDLIPFDRNPRKISEKAVKKVADAIQKFGWTNLILISRDDVIVAGHTRLKAAKMLGIEWVPTITLNLTEEECNAYRIADNRVGEESSWDHALLREAFIAFGDIEGDEALSTGFDSHEIESILGIADNDDDEESREDDEDEEGTERITRTVCCPECGHEFKPKKPRRRD